MGCRRSASPGGSSPPFQTLRTFTYCFPTHTSRWPLAHRLTPVRSSGGASVCQACGSRSRRPDPPISPCSSPRPGGSRRPHGLPGHFPRRLQPAARTFRSRPCRQPIPPALHGPAPRPASSRRCRLRSASQSQTEAWHGVSSNRVGAGFGEKERGSITVGRCVDLVVLSRGVLAAPPEENLQTRVLMTPLVGKPVWRDPSFE